MAESLISCKLPVFVLCTDFNWEDLDKTVVPVNIQWLHLTDLPSAQLLEHHKKYERRIDAFRWGLKPMLLKLLCKKFNEVIYCDNDLYFLDDVNLIFEKFKNFRILLTPHFYPKSPITRGDNWFEANFQVGIYNAGFIGVRNDAIDFLDYWIECCSYAIRKSYYRGLYDDQKYLDLVPAYFQAVYIHSSPTWNFSGWNDWCEDVQLIDEQLFVGQEKVLFVHFAQLSLDNFKIESHPAHQILLAYQKALKLKTTKHLKEKYFSKRRIHNYFRYQLWLILKRIQTN